MAISLQNHIHLSATQSDVQAGNLLSTWAVSDRLETPQVLLTAKRTLNGGLRFFAANNAGSPIQLADFKYTLVVKEDSTYTLLQRVAQIKAMHGKKVYLHDNFHDATDHTAGIKTMLLASVGDFPVLSPGLQRFYVDIELMDASV